MSYDLRHISFSTAKKGCASGSNIVCTEDGGKTWKERLSARPLKINDFFIELHGVSFVAQSDGWTVGEAGQIMKTEDGGITWKIAVQNTGCGQNAFFINNKIGWIHGYSSPYICKTIDGGQTLQKQDMGINVSSVFFVSETTGWAAGTKQEISDRVSKSWSVIQETIDGGKTWKTQFNEFLGNKKVVASLYNVFFLNAQVGWVVGKKGIILHTEDGGEHWAHQISNDPILQLTNVHFVDSKTGWITGIKSTDSWAGVVLHTTDSGNHWEIQNVKQGVGLEETFFTDDKNGWVTGETEWGEESLLYHTTDGGKTWKETVLGHIGKIYPVLKATMVFLLQIKHGWRRQKTGEEPGGIPERFYLNIHGILLICSRETNKYPLVQKARNRFVHLASHFLEVNRFQR